MLRAKLTPFLFQISYTRSIPCHLLKEFGAYKFCIRACGENNWYVNWQSPVIYLPESPGDYPYAPDKQPPSQDQLKYVVESLKLFDNAMAEYYTTDKDSIQFLKIE